MEAFKADLCAECVYFVAYGTLGDASAGEPSEEQKRTDREHAYLMFGNLGVTVLFFDDTEDTDGGFSHSGCEGCGKQSCHVYTGNVLYEGQQ